MCSKVLLYTVAKARRNWTDQPFIAKVLLLVAVWRPMFTCCNNDCTGRVGCLEDQILMLDVTTGPW